MIPKILHFCFGMTPDFGGKPLSLVHYACIRSAVERIRPRQAFFYYEYEPNGPWWDLTRQLVTPVQIKAPTSIFGNPLLHPAHRADVVRLEKLIEHGGIYLDCDVFVHRDFDDLLGHSTVLGQEGIGGSIGLCNAVILGEPGAPFLKKWYAEYKSFRSKGWGHFWNEHSVEVPLRLWKSNPQAIAVLPHTAFFWPTWQDDGIELLFNSMTPIVTSETYANHLWESPAWNRFLRDLTPGRVRRQESNFHVWVRPIVASLPDNYGAPPLVVRIKRTVLQICTPMIFFLRRIMQRLKREMAKFLTSSS